LTISFLGEFLMSIDRSLRLKDALVRHRNVLTRAERIMKLKDEERWEEGSSVLGLSKVAHRKSHAGKKAAKEKEAAEAVPGAEGAPTAEAAAPAAAGKAVAPAAGKAPAAGAAKAAAPAAAKPAKEAKKK
jgi:small basic protein (TIGR04137 family)